MAYFLEALLFRSGKVDAAVLPFRAARVVSLTGELSLVPLTDELLREISCAQRAAVDELRANSPARHALDSWARQASQRGCVGYIVAEYFGGGGSQFGVAWSDGDVVLGPLRQDDAINQVLRFLGVTPGAGQDEFDSVGLGRHRHTHEWVEPRETRHG